MSKYCPKCNEEYNETTMFCMKCGSALQEKEVSKEEKNVMKKRKIIELSVLVAVLLAVIVGGIIFVSSYFSASAKIKRYLAAGDWDAAKEVYAEAIEGDDDAEEEVKKSLAAVVNQVKSDYTNQTIDYDTAKSTLDAVKSIAGKVDGYTDVQEYISKLMESRKAYTSAEQLLVNKEYTEAVKYYKQVWMEDANYADAQAKIKTAKEAYKAQVLTLVDGYKAEEKYQDAVDLLQKAKKLLEDDGEIDALVIHYQKENVKKNFLAYEEAKDYAGGIAYAKVNSSVIEADPDLSAKLTAYMNSYRSDVMTRAEAAFTENGYTAAVAIVDEAFKVLAGDEALENAKIEFKNRYRADVLKRAEEAFTGQGYQAAIDAINEGMKVLKDDTDLYNAREEYESYAPKLLFDMVQLEGDDFIDSLSSGTDNVGNQYTNAYKLYVGYDDSSTYILDGKYSKLEGTLALSSGDKNNRYEAGLTFYGDGKLLGYSPMFKAGVKPQSFSINVTGVVDLEIVCVYGSWDYSCLYTEGLYLYK